MLSAKRCPFTGIVNFYADDEPHIAVGAIARCGTSASTTAASTASATTDGFTWRCLTRDAELSGHAPDLETARFRLTRLLETNGIDTAVAHQLSAA